MNKNWLVLIGMMVGIGLVSILLTYFRSEKMSSPTDLASKGLAAVQKGNVIFYELFMPILVGLISFYVYRGMLARSPETAQTTFLYLAIGIGIVLTIVDAAWIYVAAPLQSSDQIAHELQVRVAGSTECIPDRMLTTPVDRPR